MSQGPAAIRLNPPRRWGSVAWLILAAAFLAGSLVAREAVDAGFVDALWKLLAVVVATTLLLAGIGLGVYSARRARGPREIRFGDTFAHLPAGQASARMLVLPYERIFGVERMGRGGWSRLVIGVRGRLPITYPERLLEPAEAAARIQAELRGRIARLPRGAERLDSLDARHRLHERAFSGPWPISWTLLLLLVAVFALEAFSGAMGNAAELARLGGQVPSLVREGQWWRLATASLLHLDLLHLYMNGLGLLAMGYLLERLLGGWRFGWLLLWGALGSGLASVAFGDHLVSVGASGAIFALVGAWIVLNTRHREDLPPALCPPGWYIAAIAALEILFELWVPNVDSAAHAGGFAAGVLAALLVLPQRPLARCLASTPRWLALATTLLAFGFAGCAALGVSSLLRQRDAFDAQLLAALLDAERPETPGNDDVTNQLSWLIAISPDPPPGGYDLPLARMRELVTRRSDELAYLDTLATLHYRAGDADAAVRLQQRAFELGRGGDRTNFYAAQLARFYAKRLETHGVLGAEQWQAPLPVVTRVAAGEGEPGGSVLLLDLHGPLAEGVVLDAVIRSGERLHGLLRVELGARDRSTVRLTATDDTFERLPEDARVELAWLEARTPLEADATPFAGGRWSWRVYPYAPAVAVLP